MSEASTPIKVGSSAVWTVSITCSGSSSPIDRVWVKTSLMSGQREVGTYEQTVQGSGSSARASFSHRCIGHSTRDFHVTGSYKVTYKDVPSSHRNSPDPEINSKNGSKFLC